MAIRSDVSHWEKMKVTYDFQWRPIRAGNESNYLFPMPVNSANAADVNGPAVYRWVIYATEPGDLRRVYIGEAEMLSRRIRGYLNPGPTQQTNIRMKAEFEGEIAAGHKVMLEALHFDALDLSGVKLTMGDLSDKNTRRFLEASIVLLYSRLGYTVLNA